MLYTGRGKGALWLSWCALACLVATLAWSAAPPAEAASPLRAGLPRLGLRALPTVDPTPSLPTGRQRLEHAGASLFVYPPLSAPDGRASVVMMLHGMCSDALATCDYCSRAGREGSFLLCPEGNGRCGDRPDWRGSGEDKARFLDGVMATVRATYGPHLRPAGNDILIGFSRGAFVARDVAYARPGRYRGLILIGAALKPDPKRLRASGIRRVVLAAGDYDCARPTMQLAAARLNAGGLESRYVSTGKIWHQLPADLERILRDAIEWVRGG